MRKILLAAAAIVVLSFAVALYAYQDPSIPDRVPAHWNAAGQVDGYLPKFWGLFFVPILGVLLLPLFIVLPRIDPLKKNIMEFRHYYDGFIAVFMGFLFYLQIITLLLITGSDFHIIQALAPAFGVLFYCIGILLGKSKRNWFIGIRTPWTLSSDKIWDRTHALGGRLFKIAGVLSLLGAFFYEHALWFILAPIIAFSAFLVVYSYFEYRKQGKRPKKKAHK